MGIVCASILSQTGIVKHSSALIICTLGEKKHLLEQVAEVRQSALNGVLPPFSPN